MQVSRKPQTSPMPAYTSTPQCQSGTIVGWQHASLLFLCSLSIPEYGPWLPGFDLSHSCITCIKIAECFMFMQLALQLGCLELRSLYKAVIYHQCVTIPITCR